MSFSRPPFYRLVLRYGSRPCLPNQRRQYPKNYRAGSYSYTVIVSWFFKRVPHIWGIPKLFSAKYVVRGNIEEIRDLDYCAYRRLCFSSLIAGDHVFAQSTQFRHNLAADSSMLSQISQSLRKFIFHLPFSLSRFSLSAPASDIPACLPWPAARP